MKSTRETRRMKEEGHANLAQNKKNAKGEDLGRPLRAAFGDLTNAVQKKATQGKREVGKKVKVPAETKETRAKSSLPKSKAAGTAPAQRKTKKASAQPSEVTGGGNKAKPATEKKTDRPELEHELTSSQESSDKADDASPNLSDILMAELELSPGQNHSRMSLDKSTLQSPVSEQKAPVVAVPAGVEDIDILDQEDLTLVSIYAADIFKYYKEREEQFILTPYMAHQPHVTQRMRAVLVDWLVEVQENFELNHETLYLAVKLVDTYLTIVPNLRRENVQLVGAVALFLAAKFDERLAPAIEDFIYICDHAYDRRQFMAMERELFRTVGFDLGRPLSYRFLRRYARCGRSEIKTLYLARYLLELSLMEYRLVFHRDSMLAASCLYIARQMRKEGGWTPTLEYYTGYKLTELKPLILELNPLFTVRRHPDLCTIKDKYKHYLFHSVADIPPVSEEQLFPQESSVETDEEH